MDMPKLLASLEKTDDNTVVMKLTTPNVAILANLAMDFMAIGSKEYADFLLRRERPSSSIRRPVGTGPFSFVSYQKDSVIRYKANKDYYGEKPLVDDLVFAITPDATARYAKLKAGECHVNAYPRPADLEEMEKDPTLKVINMPGLNVAYWAFNAQKPPFDKKEVRQALSMAIDRDAIIKDVYLGAGSKATTLIPPTCGPSTTRFQTCPLIRRRPRRCWLRPASRRRSTSIFGTCRCRGPLTLTASVSAR